MWIAETVVVALSLYSALPMPQIPWNGKNTRYALCAFPLVGALAALALWGWCALCGVLNLPPLLRGAGLCLLPPALTGGIHLDGYADTADALASHASPERRQEILHDPHAGAFAVIRLCMYFAGSFALCSALRPEGRALPLWGLSFLLSRSLSGWALTAFPLSPGSSLARSFAETSVKKRAGAVLLGEALVTGGALLLLGGLAGALMWGAALLLLALYYRTAVRDFGGTGGDLAGWFLQRAEFWMLAVLVLCQQASVL